MKLHMLLNGQYCIENDLKQKTKNKTHHWLPLEVIAGAASATEDICSEQHWVHAGDSGRPTVPIIRT